MCLTDKSLQSEKFKQVVGGLGKAQGKSPAPDQIRSARDPDRSFPCWPGLGYFGAAPGGVLSTAERPRPFKLWNPQPPQSHIDWCGASLDSQKPPAFST